MVIVVKAYDNGRDLAGRINVRKEIRVSTKEEFAAAVRELHGYWLSYVHGDNGESIMYYDDALSLLPSA